MVGGGQPDMHGVEPAVERGLQILEPPSVPADQPDRQPLVEDREHRLLLRPAHDRNPDLERVDADLGQDPRDLHLLGLGEGDPGRLLALAKGRVFEHDRHRKLPSVQRNRCPRPGLGGRRRRSRGADLAREVAGRSLQQGHVPPRLLGRSPHRRSGDDGAVECSELLLEEIGIGGVEAGGCDIVHARFLS